MLTPKFSSLFQTLSVLFLLSFTSFVNAGTSGLWPLPRELTSGTTALRLAPGFHISAPKGAPSDLQAAIQRTASYLKTDKLAVLTPDRGASKSGQVRSARTLTSLTLSLTSSSSKVTSLSDESIKPVESRSEGYTLSVPADGSAATLSANSTLGLFRGLTTFQQLWWDLDGTTYTLEAPYKITDSPAYPYRGLHLDTSRNYFPVSDIKRVLDTMALVKLNTFHWHVVDSQSFPLVIPGFTDLAAKGAYSQNAVYTPQDVKDIVQYAAARGIDVMPEIDTPGHTSILALSHPEHIACFLASPWTQFANEPPAGQLRLANAATTNYTANLISAAAKLFPGKLFSTGGDELNKNCYDKDPQTQSDLAASGKTLEQALDTFVQATHKPIHDQGKSAVVWEEMVLDHPVTLANDTLVLVWISSQNAAAIVQKGHKLVHAASDYFYLDCGLGGWVGQNPLGNSWCDPYKTWQKSYSFDPLANITSDQAHLVMGGQSLLWAEQTGPSNLDQVMWPRAASAAEVFWSGPGGDIGKALPRLHALTFRMQQRGVKASPLQPLWCALRDGACDLNA